MVANYAWEIGAVCELRTLVCITLPTIKYSRSYLFREYEGDT